MAILKIFLEEGFSKDTIEIMINDNKKYQKDNITTNPDLGLAESITINGLNEYNILTIFVKSRDISKNISIHILETTYLALSIINNTELHYRISSKPFKYL
jgi:hypothetical protein